MPNQSPPVSRSAQLEPINCFLQGKDFLGSDYFLFLGLILVGTFVGGLVPVIIVGAMWCGICKCFLQKESGRPAEFNTLFEGFNDFVPGLITTLCIVGLGIVAVIPYMILFFGGFGLMAMGEAIPGILGLLLIAAAVAYILIINGFFSVALMFSCCLIVERKMEGFEAFQAAAGGILKNIWGLVLVSLVGNLIVMVGFMLCVIPGILAIPMIFAGHFVCYRKIFPRGTKASPPVKAQAAY